MTGGIRSREWEECKQGQRVAGGDWGQGMVEGRAEDGVEGGVAQGISLSCLISCLPSRKGSTAPTRASNKRCPCRKKQSSSSRQWECVLPACVLEPLHTNNPLTPRPSRSNGSVTVSRVPRAEGSAQQNPFLGHFRVNKVFSIARITGIERSPQFILTLTK